MPDYSAAPPSFYAPSAFGDENQDPMPPPIINFKAAAEDDNISMASFGVVQKSFERHKAANSAKVGAQYRRKFTDPTEPAAQAYLRAHYPDFDE